MGKDNANARGKGVSLSSHGFRSLTRLRGLHFKLDPHGGAPAPAPSPTNDAGLTSPGSSVDLPPAANVESAAAEAAAAAAGAHLRPGVPAAARALPACTALGWEVEPTAAALGAVLHGPDLTRVGAVELAAIREALLAFEVVFFREQHGFAPSHHRALAEYFGGVQHHPACTPFVWLDSVPRRARRRSTACATDPVLGHRLVTLRGQTRTLRAIRRSPSSRTTASGRPSLRSGTPT